MPTDLASAGRSARENIPVPDVPLGRIVERSRAAVRTGRRRSVVALIASLLVVAGVGAAYAARIYQGVHLSLGGGKVAVSVSSLVMVREPTAQDVRDIASRATFPVIFPVGLPSDAHMTTILYAPKDRPDSVTVDYAGARGPAVGFLLFDTSHLANDGTALPPGMTFNAKDTYVWRVGGETVIVPKARLSLADQKAIEAAMSASSPSDSLRRNLPSLRTIYVEGAPPQTTQTAMKYVHAGDQAVLLDQRSVRLIPGFASKGMPFMDTRIIDMDDIPTKNGQPDYSGATLSWPKHGVITSGGVRGIAAALRYVGARGGCTCAILFRQSDASTFDIWTIPSQTGNAVREYHVDARTETVTPAG